MSADYTTRGLLANLKRRGFIPTGSGLDTAALLQVLTEQLRVYIPAFLRNIREEFIVAQLEIAVTSSTVPIPERACGIALRTIGWKATAAGDVRPLTRIEPERRYGWPTSGEPVGFMFQGNNAILIPAISTGTLVVSYQQRPGELVLPTDCTTFYSYDDATTMIVNAPPVSFVVGAKIDVVSYTPNFELRSMDLKISAMTDAGGGLIRLAFVGGAALPTNLKAGDFVCLATETCVPQLPLECFDLLAQATAFQLATDTGSVRLPGIAASLERLEKQTMSVLSPRADGSPRIIVSSSSLGRRGL